MRLADRRGIADRLFALATHFSISTGNYWHPIGCVADLEAATHAALHRATDSRRLPTGYYVNLSAKVTYSGNRSPEGFPLRADRPFVIDAAQYILGVLQSTPSLDGVHRRRLAQGLRALSQPGDVGILFFSQHPAYHGTVPPGWLSAMAQGQCSSAFFRLGDHEAGFAAVDALLNPDPSFVTSQLGVPALLECVAPAAGVVLNGMIFALLGLLDAACLSPDYSSKLDTWAGRLRQLAPLFVTKRWSYYELGRRRRVASGFYHRLNGQLLLAWGLALQDHACVRLALRCLRSDTPRNRAYALLVRTFLR